MVAGAFFMSSTSLVDQSMAAMLGAGSVSTLNYGGKVLTLILGIGSVSLGTAVFPHFSRMVAASDWASIRHTLKTYIYLILLVTIPLTLILVYFSEPLVRLFFERGAFTSADTWRVSQVQALFLLQVPFYFLGILMVRLISSLKMNRILMQAAIINLFLKIIFNYLFMQRLGAAGIALSTTLVYAVSFIYYSVILCKQMRHWDEVWKR
jgi:putative peptidoglycan lipid II flippase